MKTFYSLLSKSARNFTHLLSWAAMIGVIAIQQSFGQTFDWRPISPLPTGQTLNDVEFAPGGSPFAVGSGGTVLSSEDDGLNWLTINDPNDFSLLSIVHVEFFDQNTGYILLRGGDQVMKTTSGGEGGWTSANGNGQVVSGPNNTTVGLELQVIDANTVVAVNSIRAHITTDGGSNWTNITPTALPSSPNLRDIYFLDANTGYLLSRSNGLYKTTNGGGDWTQLTGFTGIEGSIVHFEDVNNGWVVEGTGHSLTNTIHRTTDGGVNWTSQTYSGGNQTARELIFTSATNGKLFDSNNVYATADAGVTWTVEGTVGFVPSGVSYDPVNDQYLLGSSDGNLGIYADGTFLSLTNSLTGSQTIGDIHFIDINNGFVLESLSTGQVHRTTDGGISWSTLGTGGYSDIEFPTNSDGYMVGNLKNVLKTTDGGATWNAATPLDDGSYTVRSAGFFDANTGWVVGSSSKIFKTSNGGDTWTEQTAPVASLTLYDVVAVSATTAYISGTGGNVLKTINGGDTWTALSFDGTGNVFDMFWLDANTGWVVDRDIWKTTNGGDTWSGDGFNVVGNVSEIHFVDANTGFATFDGGTIYRTTNGGDLWEEFLDGGLLTSSLTEIHAIDADNIWTAGARTLFNRTSFDSSLPSTIGLFLPEIDFCPNEEFIATFVADREIQEQSVSIQLSDENGSFTSPTVIGTMPESQFFTGNVKCTIPGSITPSSNYRMRAVTAGLVGNDNGTDLSVGGAPTPSSFITSTAEVCRGNTGVVYEVEDIEGMTYLWSYSGSGSFSIIGNGNPSITMSFFNSATSGTLSVTLSNGCGSGTPLELPITVGIPGQGGTASGGNTVCAGSNAPELTLTGHSGNVIRWEQSTTPFTVYTPIASSDNATFTPPGTIDETTRFRAVVQNGGCDEAVSSFTTVTTTNQSVGGTISGTTEITAGMSPGTLTLTGQTGVVVRWEQAIAPFTTFTPISHTLTVYNPGALSVDTQFRAVVQSSPCDEAASDPIQINIPPTANSTTPFSPENGAIEVALNSDFTLTFSEPVRKRDGATAPVQVRVFPSGSLHYSMTIDDPSIEVSGSTLTFNPGFNNSTYQHNTQYYVVIPQNAIEDLVGNAFAGIDDNSVWRYTTFNSTPMIEMLTPEDGTNPVQVDDNFIIEFNESVTLSGGLISFKRFDNDDVIRDIATLNPGGQVSIDGNEVTINPGLNLPEGTHIYISITAGVFRDADDIISEELTKGEWDFTTETSDGTPPILTGTTPMDDAIQVPTNQWTYTATFDQPIRQGSDRGAFRLIRTGTGDIIDQEEFPYTHASFSGNSVTIDFNGDNSEDGMQLLESEDYHITILNNTIEDMTGSVYPGTSDSDWNFRTFDSDPPSDPTLFPAHNSSGFVVNDVLTLTFTEEIQKGPSGSVDLYQGTSLVESIPVSSDQLTANGDEFRIELSDFLSPNTTYNVRIGSMVILDFGNNNYDGINDATSWVFTTELGESDPPLVANEDLYPEPGGTDVEPEEFEASMTFDEDVYLGSGNVQIWNATENILLQTIDVQSSGDIETEDSDVYIAAESDLPDGREIAITVCSTCIVDRFGNPFAGLFDDDWTFITFDEENPGISSLTPNGATSVSVNTHLEIQFDEPVNVSAGGNILIRSYDLPGLTPFETISAVSDQVTGSGTRTITIDPSITLDREFHYYIQIEDDAFTDIAGNFFDGLFGVDDWEFTTESKLDQNINFPELDDITFGELMLPIILFADSDSELPVTFNLDSGPATLMGNTLTITGAGTVTVSAIQAGDGTYNSASVQQSFEVFKGTPIITFELDDKLTTDESFEIGASVNQDIPVTLDFISGPAMLSGNTVTLTGESGIVTIMASTAETADFNAASTTANFNVSDPAKTDQEITFESIAAKVFGQSFNLEASSDSGLEVDFSIVDGPIDLIGTLVTITGTGTATIAANQEGDGTYNPAEEVRQTFVINKADQLITIDEIADKLITDAAFMASASVGSGLPLTYEVSGPATINVQEITLTGEAGTVTLTVSQAGDDNYNPATAQITFEVTDPTPVNSAPTDISLSSLAIAENEDAGTVVGELSTTDTDENDSHTYSLVTGEGDDDNGSFQINNTQLVSAVKFDFEVKSSYSIRIGTDDGNGGVFEKSFTITIEDVNEVITGIDDDLALELIVYPNPAVDYARIKNLDPNGSALLELINLEGLIISQQVVNNKEMEIDLSQVKPGLYVIRTSKGKQFTTTLLLKE